MKRILFLTLLFLPFIVVGQVVRNRPANVTTPDQVSAIVSDSISALKPCAIFYSNNGSTDLSTDSTDAYVQRCGEVSLFLNLTGGFEGSNLIANFNNPDDSDLGKTVTITALDENTSWNIQVAGLFYQGEDIIFNYTLRNGETIILTATQTDAGNRWVFTKWGTGVQVFTGSVADTATYTNADQGSILLVGTSPYDSIFIMGSTGVWGLSTPGFTLPQIRDEISDSTYFYPTLSAFTAVAPTTTYPLNKRIKIGNTGAEYIISSDVISSSDTITTIPVSGGAFAISSGAIYVPIEYLADSISNAALLQKLFNASIKLKLPVILPSDTIEVANAAGINYVFSINRLDSCNLLEIKGSNSALRVIQNDLSVSSLNVFKVAKDIDTKFTDFKIIGPNEPLAPKFSGTYSINSGSDTVTWVSGPTFADTTINSITASIINRYIYIAGAGVAGDTLRAYVTSKINSTTVKISTTASATVTGASGYWYSSWQHRYTQNVVYAHEGNSYVKMGSGKAMTGYPGKNIIKASGFNFPNYLADGYIYADWGTGSGKRQSYKVKSVLDSATLILYTTIDETLSGATVVANTSNSWYQSSSKVYFDNFSIQGQFRSGIVISDGIQKVHLNQCDISVMETGLATEPDFSDIPMINSQVNLIDTDVHDTGLQYRGDGNIHPADGNGRLLYIGEGTGLTIRGGNFDGNYRTGLSVYGTGAANIDTFNLLPVVISGATFGSRLSTSIQTGTYQTHNISNCLLRAPIYVYGSTNISNTDMFVNYLDANSRSNVLSENIYPVLIDFVDTRTDIFSWSGGRIVVENTSIPVFRNFNPNVTSKINGRSVLFSNVEFSINWNSGATVNFPAEGIFYLGESCDFFFNNCNFKFRSFAAVAPGAIRFLEATAIKFTNCNFKARNDSNADQRLFAIYETSSTTSDPTTYFLDEITLKNINFQKWNGTKFVAPAGQLGEIFYVTANTAVDIEVVPPTSDFISVNSLSTSAGFTKKVKRASVSLDFDQNIITPYGYGSGLKEAADISKTNSSYIARFATEGTIVEDNISNYWTKYQTTKAVVGSDSSFVHDPVVDSTYIKGKLRHVNVGEANPDSVRVTSAAGVVSNISWTQAADSTFSKASFGEMYIDDIDTDTIAFTGGSTTPAKSTDWLAGELQNFTYSNGRLTYTGTQSITVKIDASISFSFAESGTLIEGWIYKTGSEVSKSEFHRQIGTGGDVGNSGISCLLTLVTNDYIELFFAPGAHSGNDNLIIQNANVNVTRIK